VNTQRSRDLRGTTLEEMLQEMLQTELSDAGKQRI